MEEDIMNLASERLASIRKNTDLCDASLEVAGEKLPVHKAVLADISPVFKAALCGKASKREDNCLKLKEATRQSMDVILDFAYGVYPMHLEEDIEKCLDVLRDAHRYKIGFLIIHTTSTACAYSTWKHRCQVFQHAALYGSNRFREMARTQLAEDIVVVARKSLAFGSLSARHLALVLSSNDLIATEDEKLWIMQRWRKLNPMAATAEIDGLFEWLRMERCRSTEEVEKLCKSEWCPAALFPQMMNVGVKKLREGIAARNGTMFRPLNVDDSRVYLVSGQWTSFSFRNLAMAALPVDDAGFLLKVEHREKRSSRRSSFVEQVTRQWFCMTVRREPFTSSEHIVYKIRFTKEPFCIRIGYEGDHPSEIDACGKDCLLTMVGNDFPHSKFSEFLRQPNAEIFMSEEDINVASNESRESHDEDLLLPRIGIGFDE